MLWLAAARCQRPSSGRGWRPSTPGPSSSVRRRSPATLTGSRGQTHLTVSWPLLLLVSLDPYLLLLMSQSPTFEFDDSCLYHYVLRVNHFLINIWNLLFCVSSPGDATAPGLDELASLLTTQGLGKYTDVFLRHEVDLQTFATLTDEELKEIGIPTFGARKKLLLLARETKKKLELSWTDHNDYSSIN